MTDLTIAERDVAEPATAADDSRSPRRRSKRWRAAMVPGVLAAVVAVGAEQAWHGADAPSAPPPRW
jgi:hypothetical protein